MIEKCIQKGCEEKLFKFLIESDGEDLLGRPVELKNIEQFMNKLTHSGDGGIVAFSFKKHQQHAVLWALEIQNLMPVFNFDPERLVEKPIPPNLKNARRTCSTVKM